MAVSTTALFQTSALTAGSENATTAQATRFLVDKLITFASAGGSITAKVIPKGGTAGASNVLAVKTFSNNETYVWPELAGTTLEAGDTISFLPATGVVANVRISGRMAS